MHEFEEEETSTQAVDPHAFKAVLPHAFKAVLPHAFKAVLPHAIKADEALSRFPLHL